MTRLLRHLNVRLSVQLSLRHFPDGSALEIRCGAAPWLDGSENIWLFGRWGYANCLGDLNDLWELAN